MDTTRMVSMTGLSEIFLGIYPSIRRNRDTPKSHAADRLAEAFKEEIQDLSLGKGDAYEILKEAFPKHEKAYLQFRPYLNRRDLRKFDKAWKKYSCRRQEKAQTILAEIFPEGSKSVTYERQQIALEEILEFLSLARKYSHPRPALKMIPP
jgi:hypothetical protein